MQGVTMKGMVGSKSTSVKKNIAKGVHLRGNLQDGYNFPSHRVCTDLSTDIVWWDDGKR